MTKFSWNLKILLLTYSKNFRKSDIFVGLIVTYFQENPFSHGTAKAAFAELSLPLKVAQEKGNEKVLLLTFNNPFMC